jgi:cell volume regulation protein A
MIGNFEPSSLALFLTIFALLMSASAVLSLASEKTGVPVALLFLLVGMLAGSKGGGAFSLNDYAFCLNLGTIGLVLILFDGGFNTPLAWLREGVSPAVMLATLGVLLTTLMVGLCARLLGFSWEEALLLGSIVSPTDAAAVFSSLRRSKVQPKRRVAMILELESGLNDPVAIALTVALTQSLELGSGRMEATLAGILPALAIGAAFGLLVGYGGRLLLTQVRLSAGGLYPVLTVGLALLAFGLPTLINGSGFLAVYIAAVIIGNGHVPYHGGVARVHDAIAWFSQISLFLLLGLLVHPSGLIRVAPAGLCLGLFLAFIARPLAVIPCLLPFRYPVREVAYIGWAGLRGAVPIVLAIYPILAHIGDGQEIFDTVFFVVALSTLIPGTTVRWLTSRIGLGSGEPQHPPAVLEIVSTRILRGAEVLSFSIGASAAVCGVTISELPFPADSAVMLIIRGQELVVPSGSTELVQGDHVYVLCRPEDQPLVRLLFGLAETE